MIGYHRARLRESRTEHVAHRPISANGSAWGREDEREERAYGGKPRASTRLGLLYDLA